MLEIERSKASFSVEELKVYLHGREYLDRQDKILPILQAEVYPVSLNKHLTASCSSLTPAPLSLALVPQPAFDKSKMHYMSRGDKYRAGLTKEKVLARISRQEGWGKADNTMAEELLGKSS